MALEIWEEDVAEAVGVVAEAEGVVTTNITTINSTKISSSSSTKIAVSMVTAVMVPILLEPHHLATKSRMSNNHSRSNHQQLTNSLQVLACRMAPGDSPWAEGSHNR
jgi:hypothetical protein